MVEKGKNLSNSVDNATSSPNLSTLISKITFDSSRGNAFTPILPQLRNIHIFRRNEIVHRPLPNIHSYYMLWICVNGTGHLLIDGANLDLSVNECTLILPGQSHIRLPDSKNRKVNWLLIRFESDNKGWFSNFHNKKITLSQIAIENLALLLELYQNRESSFISSACGACLQLLLSLLHNATENINNNTPKLVSSTDACIRELCELMMQVPPEKDPFRFVAAQRNVTPEYLHVLFRQKTGFTPRDFIAKQKLDLAQHLLVNSELTISEIALRCGFSDVYPFSKFFKKRRGVSPSSYRKAKGLPLPPKKKSKQE